MNRGRLPQSVSNTGIEAKQQRHNKCQVTPSINLGQDLTQHCVGKNGFPPDAGMTKVGNR